MGRPLPLIYLCIVVFSLIAALAYQPWSFDATTYRLPRLLYWWGEKHWYWIGTLDHRLDFSSCGFEWQMLPVIEATHSDRLLFLLNWVPFLLLPGLTFFAFKALGARGRTARRWMWLLPTGYCIALQTSGLQNDGYSVNYLLAAIGFAVIAYRSSWLGGVLMSVLAASLLTGAKLSNAPLLLPLGVMLLPALGRVKLLNWKVPVVLVIAAACSFLPMALLCIKNTGDYAGDPKDQWDVKARNPVGCLMANVGIFLNDAVQPPLLPGSDRFEKMIEPAEKKVQPLMDWLHYSHPHFGNIHFGEMVYEGTAGIGFGICAYLFFVLAGQFFVKRPVTQAGAGSLLWAWRLGPILAWVAYAIMAMKLASPHTARISVPYYPLMMLSLLRCPRVAAFERRKVAGLAAGLAAFTVIPIIIFTPARPLIPPPLISWMESKPSFKSFADKYQLWGTFRDDLAPIREAIPPDVTRLGYAGGFLETSYGLWKPLGSRRIVELGLPVGSATLPGGDIQYAVITERGIRDRYSMDMDAWLRLTGAETVYVMKRNVALDGRTAKSYESWALVRLHR